MNLRIYFGVAALLFAGCGTSSDPKGSLPAKGSEGKTAAPPQTIALHVPEMKLRGGYEGAELT